MSFIFVINVLRLLKKTCKDVGLWQISKQKLKKLVFICSVAYTLNSR